MAQTDPFNYRGQLQKALDNGVSREGLRSVLKNRPDVLKFLPGGADLSREPLINGLLEEPYEGMPFNMGQMSQEEGGLLSRVRAAENNPLHTREGRGRVPMGTPPTAQAEPMGVQNIWSKVATGMRGVGDAVNQGQGAVVDNIADITGLNKFQNSLLDGTRPTDGIGGSPAPAAAPAPERAMQTIMVDGEPVEFPADATQEFIDGVINSEFPDSDYIKKRKAEASATSKLTPESTLEDASKAAQSDHQAEREQMNQAIADKTRQDLTAKGATKEQLQGWDKFTDEYDLGVIGMALLASNDGTGNIWSNLGMAMMEGKKSRTAEKDKLTAAQQQDLENELAMLKSQREGAKVGGQLGRWESQNTNDAASVRVDEAGIPIKQQTADAATANARAAQVRAEASMKAAMTAAKASGRSIADNKQVVDGAAAYLRGNGVSKSGAEENAVQFATDVADFYEKSGSSLEEAQRFMLERYKMNNVIEPTGWFSFSDYN